MIARLALAAALIATAACRKPREKIGGACEQGWECESRACLAGACVTGPRQDGEACSPDALCTRTRECYDGVCRTTEAIRDLESKKKLAAEKEMLEQSGVDAPAAPAAEQREKTGGGLPVRVVRTERVIDTARGVVLAACRDDERLIGGSCSSIDRESGPDGYGPTDSIGARWSCAGIERERMIAHALCQKLPAEGGAPK